MPYVPQVPNSATGGPIVPVQSTLVDGVALDDILQGFIVGLTGLPGNMVRPRWQLVPLPAPDATTDWCAIGITERYQLGVREISQHYTVSPSTADPVDPTGDGYTESWEVWFYRLMVTFYGPNSSLNGRSMLRNISIAQNLEYLYPYSMQIVRVPRSMRTMSELVNQQYIQRQDIELELTNKISSIWPIENIQKAQITINNGDDGNTETVVSPLSVYPLIPPP
jgi:hypothetical protein